MIYVLAGSYEQARYWAEHEQNLSRPHWRYAGNPDSLRGLLRPVVVVVGQYWHNPQAYEALSYLSATDATIIRL